MCFGFLGIQFGFALQNANVSRIFETLGAKVDDIPVLWIAAPLTGLFVQPIVGYFPIEPGTGLGGAGPTSSAARCSPRWRCWRCRTRRRCGWRPACSGSWMPRSTSRWSRSAPSSATTSPRSSAHRLRDAEFLHRHRRGRGVHSALASHAQFGVANSASAGRDSRLGASLVLRRRRGVLARGALDHAALARIPAGADGVVRGNQAREVHARANGRPESTLLGGGGQVRLGGILLDCRVGAVRLVGESAPSTR